MSHSIFISYRTNDEPFAALLIEQRLAARFGRDQIFRDSRAIPLGTHFPERIMVALRQCRALVAVMGARWAGREPGGGYRIDRPDDYVRREIAFALRRDILVVPVLVEPAELPDPADLPAEVRPLVSRQYLRLGVRSADRDVDALVRQLAHLLGGGRPGRRRRGDRDLAPVPHRPLHHSIDVQAVMRDVYKAG